MVGRVRELNRRLAGSGEDTFIKLWEGWGYASKSWVWKSLQPSRRDQRALSHLRKASPQPLGCFSLAPLSSLGSSVLTFVFPFGLLLSLQIGVVNSSFGKESCVLGMEH